MAISAEATILKMVKNPFGFPLIPIETPNDQTTVDALIKDNYLLPALIEYYTRRPYEWGVDVSDSGQGTFVNIPNLTNLLSLSGGVEAYFVGVIGMTPKPVDDISFNSSGGLYSNYMALALGQGFTAHKRWDDILMHLQEQGSLAELLMPNVQFRFDPVQNKIHLSAFNGTMGMVLGFGFNDCRYIMAAHFKIVAMLTVLNMAQSFKVARGTAELDELQIRMNPEILSTVIDDINQKLPAELQNLTTPLVFHA